MEEYSSLAMLSDSLLKILSPSFSSQYSNSPASLTYTLALCLEEKKKPVQSCFTPSYSKELKGKKKKG